MEDFGAGGFSGFDAGDDVAGGGFAGVSGGGEDDGDRGIGGPFEGRVVEVPGGSIVEDLCEIRPEAVHDWLRFGVTHADVEFEGFGAVGRHHQSGVEEAGERGTFLAHAFDGRAHDRLHDRLGLFAGEDSLIGVGSHAAGVGAVVVVENVFVVLGGQEREDGCSVGEGDEADLFADEEFFNDQTLAGGADKFSGHELFYGGAGFFQGLGDDDTFAGGEAVGFQDDRRFEVFEGFQGVGFIGRGMEACGGDVVTGEEFLGEDLAALELSGGLDGAKDGAAGLAELVYDAIDQWGLGADDCEVDAVVGCELEVVVAGEAGG